MTEVTRQIQAPLPPPPSIPPTRPRVYSNLPGFPEVLALCVHMTYMYMYMSIIRESNNIFISPFCSSLMRIPLGQIGVLIKEVSSFQR